MGPQYQHFVILDTRSSEDDTALLVEVSPVDDESAVNDEGTENDESTENNSGKVQTVRIPFSEAQIMIAALEVGSIGFREIQDNARAAGGTWRERVKPQRGGPAPRKMLRAYDAEEEGEEDKEG